MNHPLLLLLMTGVGLYCARLWLTDLKSKAAQTRSGETPTGNDGTIPGAEPASGTAVGIAVAGALVILALETWGETVLGVAAQQSRMTALFAVYSVIAAPVIEEIIFRGLLVIDSPRRTLVWAGVIGASVVFAALHPFLWRWDDAGFAWTLGAKGWFSTGIVFATSLWLYAARLGPWNPRRSLLPCVAAHAAKNLGVVVIKGALGFLGGWW